MIEIATGVAFLMSSLYGAGHANAQTIAVAQTPTVISAAPEQSTTTEAYAAGPLTDAMSIQSYMRLKYAKKPMLVEIAKCESTFRQFGKDGRVMRGKANPLDVGVMQINEKYHAESALKLGYDIYSTEGNIAFGEYLYDKYGTDPWSASAKCWGRAAVALALAGQ